MSIKTLFTDIAAAIKEKNTGVVTVTPGNMPQAIRNISTGIPLYTSVEWDALSTEEKHALELVAIQQADSGYERGILVYGAEYGEASEQGTILLPYLRDYATNMNYTFTFNSINCGGVDLSNVNVVGLYVDSIRGGVISNFNLQVGALFLNNGTNDLTWDSVAYYASKKNITQTSEGVQQLFRNSYSGGNKWLIRLDTSLSFYPAYGFVSFENPIDCTVYNQWKLYTANDGSERDPISYGIILGNFSDNNLIYDVFDYGENRTGTTSRNSLAYTGTIGS